MVTDAFRTGKPPVFASGNGLHGFLANRSSATNATLYATNALITSDDVSRPAISIRARHIKIIPETRFEARDATVYIGDVPVFYFPYYGRNLGPRANNLSFTPGYRSRFGPFVLGTYTWFLNDHLDGELHLDYRQKRGFGAGSDMNFDFGRWGQGEFRYYFAHDENPRTNLLHAPVLENRQRLHFSYQANPADDLNVKALVRYQNDIGVIRDFFESEYRRDPQPNTFLEVNKFWRNFSLDVLAQPRINDFLETVERLPDVRLTGFRQQIGRTPIYYESETSAGYYRRLFPETNLAPAGLNYEAARADTYHQVTLPQTFFGWLNVAPRAGGRFTYYGESLPGARLLPR
jgi:lipopolysaccharide assembly outer membrane protein LptD (OstA)